MTTKMAMLCRNGLKAVFSLVLLHQVISLPCDQNEDEDDNVAQERGDKDPLVSL